MAIDFPPNPSVGDEYEYQGVRWRWDGTAWFNVTAVANTFAGLTDTPDNYTGQTRKPTIVNESENGLEYGPHYVPQTAGPSFPFTGDLYINDESGDLSQLYFTNQVPPENNPTGFRVGSLQFAKSTGDATIATFDGSENSVAGAVYIFSREDPLTVEVKPARRVLTTQTGIHQYQAANQYVYGGKFGVQRDNATIEIDSSVTGGNFNPQLVWKARTAADVSHTWNALLQSFDGRLSLRYDAAVNYTLDPDPLNPGAQGVINNQYLQANYSSKSAGASGTFTTADGKTVTVTDGQITSIV